MIEVKLDSVRMNLMSQQRVILLKDLNEDVYLPIWIGQYEAEAIMVELKNDAPFERPFTHDLLKNVIETLGGRIKHIYINDIRRETYYARILVDVDGRDVDIDSRPSDAIALATRAKCPIFIAESVLNMNGIRPEQEIDLGIDSGDDGESFSTSALSTGLTFESIGDEIDDEDFVDDIPPIDESQFSAFADFVNSMDLDELEDDES